MSQGARTEDGLGSGPTTRQAAAFYAPDLLEIDQWFRVADVDYLTLLQARPPQTFVPPGRDRIRLLDVGCGTGRFPALLRPALAQRPRITYDAVDPSDHCLRLAIQDLSGPYEAGQVWQCGAEELARLVPVHPYDRI